MRPILHTFSCFLLLLLLGSCEKDTDACVIAPELTTGTATDIYRMGVTLSGSIRFPEGSLADRYGILYSELQSLAESKDLTVTDGSTDFSFSVSNLAPGRTYYFSTYAYSGYNRVFGEVRSFTTSENNAPLFTAPLVTSQVNGSITVSVTLVDDGGSSLIMAGFCYNDSGSREPTFQDSVVNVSPDGSTFSATISGLEPGKTYQFRAYGANESGLSYSDLLYVTAV